MPECRAGFAAIDLVCDHRNDIFRMKADRPDRERTRAERSEAAAHRVAQSDVVAHEKAVRGAEIAAISRMSSPSESRM